MEPPANILAFRTITTILNVLQDGPTGRKGAYNVKNTSQAPELRTLNAIATLLVRQHEVTSVASQTEGNGVDLVACMTVIRNQDTWFDGDTYIAHYLTVKRLHSHC
jgi:hypothetical protein